MANSKSTRSLSLAVSSKTARPIPEYIWLLDERTESTRIFGPAAAGRSLAAGPGAGPGPGAGDGWAASRRGIGK